MTDIVDRLELAIADDAVELCMEAREEIKRLREHVARLQNWIGCTESMEKAQEILRELGLSTPTPAGE